MKKGILLSTTFAVFTTLFMANVSSAVTFGTAVNLGSPVNTSFNDRFPDISSDALDLYLSSDRTGTIGFNDIYKSTRPNTVSSFGSPSNLGATINSTDFDNGPSITSNNVALFFSSNRPLGLGGQDIWVSTLPSAPGNAGAVVNSAFNDVAPDIDSTGLFMFFHSDRTGNNDLYVAKRAVIGPWDTVGNLAAVNSGSADVAPTISSDGLTLYFSSNRGGGFGGFDLYVSIRPDVDSTFGAAVNLGSLINSNLDDMAPSISSDGSTLYFDSNRLGGLGGFDIYQSTAVPEPATIALLGIGLAGFGGGYLRRKRKYKKE